MLALVLAACIGPPPSPPDEARAALARGDAAHAAFDSAAARAAYEQALALDPAGVEARARLAHVLGDLGEAAAAAGRADEARALHERALAVAESLATDVPERPEGHLAVATALGSLVPFLSGTGKVSAARRIDASARRATELDPCLAPAYALLGITLRELSSVGGFARGVARAVLGGLPEGDLEDAEWLLRAAVALDDGDPFLHYQLALTLERRGDPAGAVRHLERALALPDREARDRRSRADADARLARLRR